MKMQLTKFLLFKGILVSLLIPFLSACSDNYHLVNFTSDDVLPASTTIVVESDALDDVFLIPNQSATALLEVTKIGTMSVKDVWLEVSMSPVNDISRTSLKATNLYFDKEKQSNLVVNAIGYDADGKAGILTKCSEGCGNMSFDLSDSPKLTFATMDKVDLGGFSAPVKTIEN